MTYRKLFLLLLALSTLAVAALWTWSCWGHAGVTVGQRRSWGFSENGRYHAGIWSGTVILGLSSDQVRPTKAEADAIPFSQHLFLPGFSPDHWSAGWRSSSDLTSRFYKYRRTGEFEFEKKFYPIVMGHSTLHYSPAYDLAFPMWVPWILMVSCSFVICRVMEKRSGAGKENKLAELPRADSITR